MHNCQKAVLIFYAAGLSSKEIAKRFKIGHTMVEDYITKGKQSIRIFGRANLTRWAIRNQYITIK